jgi:putative NIF3 family GTP cyclohydrolase 1 type 2
MIPLSSITERLDEYFSIRELGPDPAFVRYIPLVYEPAGFDWHKEFEEQFNTYFNGLMIRGAELAGRVFLAVFPTDDVLERFISEADPGDLLFMHHPLFMECGDPHGEWGRGFLPIREEYIRRIKEKRLSVYTCHNPMDVHPVSGTSRAIAEALGVHVTDDFAQSDWGPLGLIGEIEPAGTADLIEHLKEIFDIPYVDFEGKTHDDIRKVAIVAGVGDKEPWMKEAELKGAQAYITGEVHCHIDNDYGRSKYDLIMKYVRLTSMSLIGVSHSASEFLVMKTKMHSWFEREFSIQPVLLPQKKWWW